MKIFFIRGYALYACETEVKFVVGKFNANMKKIHDYIDYEFILSDAGLPYLVNEYKYDCFTESLDIAKEEYEKIDPLLRNFFEIIENDAKEKVNLEGLTIEHIMPKTLTKEWIEELGENYLEIHEKYKNYVIYIYNIVKKW